MALIGKELRGIKLLSKAGAGGMGTVYQGRVQKSRRGLTAGMDVAVKVLHPHLVDDPASLSRFKLEAGLGLSLKHPNIVRILHVGSERIDGAQVHFLVQEYIQGVTLEALVNEQDPLSDSFLRKIALQIAEALSEIHERDIIHRDLKPANVFLERDGTVKLADFGFSHVARGLRKSDSSSLFLGTVAYAAPERFGPYRATQSSDLYSFGVILYELAVGRNPFLGKDLNETLAHHAGLVPTEPILLNPSITPFMNLFILKLLKKEPSSRLGPSTRLSRILKEGQGSRWWKRNRPESQSGPISSRRQRLRVARKTPVYGRREETRLLLRLIEEVESRGQCRTVFLFGEAGSGKTRLMDNLLEELDRLGKPGRVFVVEGMQSSVKIPFFPILSAFRDAFDMRGLERDELREALVHQLTRICPERAQEIDLFSRFLISTIPGPEANPKFMPPESMVRLLAGIFKALAKQEPVILIVENVREADPPTFRMITSLLKQIRDTRLLVLLTARPGESKQTAPEIKRDLKGLSPSQEKRDDIRILQVKRLGRAEVNRILSELGFHEKMVNGPLGERIFGTTEGNPYFVLEIARLLLAKDPMGGEGSDQHELEEEIPSSIQDIFFRRLFRLTPRERQFLDFAAAVGVRFRIEEIVEGLDMDFSEAAQTVSRLQNRFALIRPAVGLYRFDHVLIRDLLYNTLDPEQRARYHLKIGARYESLAHKRSLTGREHYKAAVHFSHGEDPRRALTFFQGGFDYLRFKHFHGRAGQLAERAVNQVSTLRNEGEEVSPSFVCDLFLKQAEVSGFLGRRNKQFKALKEALHAAQNCDDLKLPALVQLRIGQYYHATSRYFSAIHSIENALSRMRRIGDRGGEADALHTLSLILNDTGETREVLGLLRSTWAIRNELSDRAGQAAVLVDIGNFLLSKGKLDSAGKILVKARALFRDLKDERGLAAVFLGLARIDLIRGAPAKALPLLQEAQRIASGVGDAALEADIRGALGRCGLEQLDFGNGARAFSEGLDLSIMIKDLARQVRFLMAQAELLAHPDNPALDRKEALAKARLAVHLSRNGELSVKDRATALDSLASVFLAMNRPRSAFAIIRKSLRILQKENGEEGMKTDFLKRYQALARKLGKKGEPMP